MKINSRAWKIAGVVLLGVSSATITVPLVREQAKTVSNLIQDMKDLNRASQATIEALENRRQENNE